MNIPGNKDYYTKLRDNVMLHPNPCFNQIELDLRRTFPFEPADEVEWLIEPLRNVLFTFLKRNSRIGYCQGMNFIVGNLLKYLTEEEAFWVFVAINEHLLPIDYYADMMGILVEKKVFEDLLVKTFPKMVQHMNECNYMLDLIAFQWFVTLFFNSLTHPSEKFVLTAFLLQGQNIIIKIGLLIVELFRKDVMDAQAFDQIYMIVQNSPMEKVTPHILSNMLKDHDYLKITNEMMDQMREALRPSITSTLQENFSKSFQLLPTSVNYRTKFVNQFYIFGGLSKYFDYLIAQHE